MVVEQRGVTIKGNNEGFISHPPPTYSVIDADASRSRALALFACMMRYNSSVVFFDKNVKSARLQKFSGFPTATIE